ncbi:MAG: ATP-binding protein [Chlorobi bacterium]|nr:ATP-binding protein [Chlorobiota bacterium]
MSKAYIICGSPAAGKTSYGRKLAEEKKAAFLDIDISTERLVQLALVESGHDKDDRDSDYFKETYREVIYQTMFDIARENLQWIDVVIAGPFTRELRMEKWHETLAAELKSEIEIHYVYCNAEERRRRMEERNSKRDKAKLKSWDSINAYYGNEEPPPFEHIFVDTSKK